ncbi:MAG: hypothetical protein AAFU77_00600 [Myxococcota bacterium]
MSGRLLFALFFIGVGCDEPAPAGQAHTPPVHVEDVPTGHFFCDMGTVEWSQEAEGDGRCPLCKMKLVKKTSDAQKTAYPDLLKKKQGHEGHEH